MAVNHLPVSHVMEPLRYDSDAESRKVVSPFENAEAALPRKGGAGARYAIWIGLAVLLVAAGAVGGVFLSRYVNDPYRTLEPFPIAKYLESHRALGGSKFKGELRVESDLGWKEGVGRLMLFTTPDDPRPIAVLVPSAVSKDIYFTKGQTYLTELEVKEGGLIYANSCRKN